MRSRTQKKRQVVVTCTLFQKWQSTCQPIGKIRDQHSEIHIAAGDPLNCGEYRGEENAVVDDEVHDVIDEVELGETFYSTGETYCPIAERFQTENAPKRQKKR